jgi:hypothetical protein
MKIDRPLQRQILTALADQYPLSVIVDTLQGAGEPHFQQNLHYLRERGLIEGSGDVDKGIAILMARITASGIDFLEDDGGLDALRSSPPRQRNDAGTPRQNQTSPQRRHKEP